MERVQEDGVRLTEDSSVRMVRLQASHVTIFPVQNFSQVIISQKSNQLKG